MMLEAIDVNHWFGSKNVLYKCNLEIDRGQFVALVGPSGAGKSTLFRAILGTHPVNQGVILVDGQEVQGPNRNVGIVYQRYSLQESLSAEDNVASGLKLDQTSYPYRIFCFLEWWRLRQQHLAEARKLLTQFGLKDQLTSYPAQLSGGQCQRVAIAQALIMKPKVLLLDEPLGALDEAKREELQDVLHGLKLENVEAKKQGQLPPHTIILVTHELNEAFLLADRVVGVTRFWKDEITGETGIEKGATIAYDKLIPPYTTGNFRDFTRFDDLKELLRKVAFDGKLCDPNEHVTFWRDQRK